MPATRLSRALMLAGVTALFTSFSAGAQAETRQFQDWTVNCPKADACVATSQGKAVRFVVGPTAGQSRDLRFVLLLAAQAKPDGPVALRLQDGRVIQLAVNRCSDANCQAIVRPDVVLQVIEQMRGHRSCMVAYEAGGQMLIEEVSLQGLNPAVAALPR